MSFNAKWILIVDDEQEIRDSVRELLTLTFGSDDIRIVEAKDGMEATSKVKNQMFDCIITDMRMPKKEGDAFIMSVRQNPFNESTPIIMLTSHPNKRLINDFRFIYLMEKPFLHDELTDLVANQLKIGGQGDRLAADMVNRLVNAASAFLNHAMSIEQVEVESPKAKSSGEKIQADFMSKVDMFEKGVHNSFSILVETKDLENLAAKMGNIDTSDLNRVAYALGQLILRHSMKKVKHTSGNFKITSYSAEQIDEKIIKKKGIIIPLKASDVRLQILACGEKAKGAA